MFTDRKEKNSKHGRVYAKSICNSFELILDYSKIYLFVSIIVKTIQGFIPISLILLMQNILNMLQNQTHLFRDIFINVLCYIGISWGSGFVNSLYGYYHNKTSLHFSKYIDLKILKQAMKFDIKDFEDPEIYDIINRAQTQNGITILNFFSKIINVFQQVITVCSSSIVLFGLNRIAVILILCVPIFRCAVKIILDRQLYDLKFERTKQEREKWYINFLTMSGIAFKEIKILGLNQYLINKYQKIYEKIIRQDLGIQKKLAFYNTFLDIFEWLITGCVLIYIVLLGTQKRVLLGDVSAYVECVNKIKGNAENIFYGIGDILDQALYINLLFMYFNLPTKSRCVKETLTNIKKIEFKNVSFKYKNNVQALKSINMTIDENDKIAIVGENGSGKTTLIKLLTGLYDEYEGEIFVNNINLKNISIETYQKKIGCVFQDYMRYETTIKENVAYGNIENILNNDDIKDTLRKVKLEYKINSEKGIDAVVGSWFGEEQLSGGEWQRLAIARALFKDADFYVLDEPDASLDILKQKELINLYKDVMQNKIGVYVSHKIDFVNTLVDRIFVMENGVIVEQGTHEELMNNKNKYYQLYVQSHSMKE